MSPEQMELLTIAFAPTGLVMLIAGGIIYSMKSKHDKELIVAQSNADDKMKDSENMAKLIDSNREVNLQLISSIGNLSQEVKSSRDSNEKIAQNSELTHREIAQSQTTSIDTNTQQLKKLGDTLTMSSNSTNEQMEVLADGIKKQLEDMTTQIDNLSSSRKSELEQISKIIESASALLDKLENSQPKHQTVTPIADKIENEDTDGHDS